MAVWCGRPYAPRSRNSNFILRVPQVSPVLRDLGETLCDVSYFAGFVSKNDFTTMLLGCKPTGIMVSREYSPGSNFLLGRRF